MGERRQVDHLHDPPGREVVDGTPLTPADVAFTFNMLKQYPDVNNTGLPVTGRERVAATT